MESFKGHIKNPLTIIAVFAGIAELSGTAVLPFLDPPVQEVYVWFPIVFPFVLVLLFFFVLWHKHHVLYAPADYSDERNFFKLAEKATPEETQEKLEGEVREAIAIGTGGSAASGDARGDDDKASTKSSNKVLSTHVSHFREIEQRALDVLSKRLGIEIDREVQFQTKQNRRILFDGMGMDRGHNIAHFFEVKYVGGQRIGSYTSFLPRVLSSMLLELEQLGGWADSPSSLVFHLVIVVGAESAQYERDEFKSQIESWLSKYQVVSKLYILTVGEDI